MNTTMRTAIAVALLLAFAVSTPGQDTTPVQEPPWPRVIPAGDETVSVYQPQIERWEGTEIAWRAAIALQTRDGGDPVYGVVWTTARADVDKDARLVTFRDFQILKVRFPTAPEKENRYLDLLRLQLPAGVSTLALDRLEASMAVSQAVKNQARLEILNDPPRIFFSTTPAVLALVDGEPVLRTLEGLGVERVINTRALIVRVGGVFYLTALDYWYAAPAVEGPWKHVRNPPDILEPVKQAMAASGEADLIEPETNDEPPAAPPAVYVSTAPAELIQTDGVPQLLPIEGTDLLQVNNSDDIILVDLNGGKYYVLLSGRWFRAKSLAGPWEFVPAANLPADFARIPSDHPRAGALVSVPNTPQAHEAAIANSIPQTAAVSRNRTTDDVIYDGPPLFVTIPGSSLQYAANCALPVLCVQPDLYYCVQNGVWFTAVSPVGPWRVAVSVPAVLYTIPASCPLHYVTYVRIYGATADVVYVGYTPGYLGAVVTTDGLVVYGTGYRYRPYIGRVWVGYPYTYGFRVLFACDRRIGFTFGFTARSVHGGWQHPWWGPFDEGRRYGFDYRRISINHVNIYRHWSRRPDWDDARRGDRDDRRGDRDNRRDDGPRGGTVITQPRPTAEIIRPPAEGPRRDNPPVIRRVDPPSRPAAEAPPRTMRQVSPNPPSASESSATAEEAPKTAQQTPPASPAGRRGSASVEPAPPAKRAAEPVKPADRSADASVEKAPVIRRQIALPARGDDEAVKVERKILDVKPPTRSIRAAESQNDVFAGSDGEVYRRGSSDAWQKQTSTGWQDVPSQRSAPKEIPQLTRESEARATGETRVRRFGAISASPPSAASGSAPAAAASAETEGQEPRGR